MVDFPDILGSVQSLIDRAVSAVESRIAGAFDSLGNVVSGAFDKVGGAIGSAVDFVADQANNAFDFVLDASTRIGELSLAALNSVTAGLTEVADQTFNLVTNTALDVAGFVDRVVSFVGVAISNGFDAFEAGASTLASGIADAVAEAVAFASRVSADAIGLVDAGIGAAVAAIPDAVETGIRMLVVPLTAAVENLWTNFWQSLTLDVIPDSAVAAVIDAIRAAKGVA